MFACVVFFAEVKAASFFLTNKKIYIKSNSISKRNVELQRWWASHRHYIIGQGTALAVCIPGRLISNVNNVFPPFFPSRPLPVARFAGRH